MLALEPASRPGTRSWQRACNVVPRRHAARDARASLSRRQTSNSRRVCILRLSFRCAPKIHFESAGPEKSIAVLPFENRSEDKANAYFADGIQDEILTRLSKIADLKVISRTSTQQYQSKPANLREIAKQLRVAHILEGRVRKAAIGAGQRSVDQRTHPYASLGQQF